MNFISHSLRFIFTSIAIVPQLSWGIPAPLPSNLSFSANCANICEGFGPEITDSSTPNPAPQPLGLLSTSPWNINDDALCCDLASANNSGNNVSNSATCPATAPSPASGMPTGGCALKVPQSVWNAISTAPVPSSTPIDGLFNVNPTSDPSQICQMAGKMINRCYYHNSQLEPQCLVYNMLTRNNPATNTTALATDSLLAVLDAITAGFCAAACVSGNPAAVSPCLGLAMIEGATELAASLTIQQEMAGVMTQYQTILSQYGQSSNDITSIGLSGNLSTNATGAAGGAAAGGAAGTQMIPTHSLKKGSISTAETGRAKRGYTCVAAPIFATLAGVRTASAYFLTQTANQACTAVSSLFSSSNNSNSQPGSSSSSSSSSSSGSGSSSSSSSGSGGGSSGGAFGGNNALSGSGQFNLDNFETCVRGGYSNSFCQAQQKASASTGAAGALDANLLSNPNLKDALSNLPTSLSELANKIPSQGAKGLMAATMPAEAGALGAALGDIAKKAQENAPQISDALGISPATPVTSGGGSAGGGGESGMGGGFSFGGGAAANSFGAKNNVMEYGTLVRNDDIFHSNSHDSIFEIISKKIERVVNRVF